MPAVVWPWLLAAVCAALLLGTIVYAGCKTWHAPKAVRPAPQPQAQLKPLEFRLGVSEKLFDVGLLALAALWGTFLSKAVLLSFDRIPQLVAFSSANLLLIGSLTSHVAYKRRVSTLMWDMAPDIPNVLDESVDYLFKTQWISFLGSLLTLLIAVLLSLGVP